MSTPSNDRLALLRVFRELNLPAALTNLALHDAAAVLDRRLSAARLGSSAAANGQDVPARRAA